MMLLAEATPKIWSSGYTLELGLQNQAALKSKGSKIAPLAINATQQTPNLEKRQRPGILHTQADTIVHNPGSTSEINVTDTKIH